MVFSRCVGALLLLAVASQSVSLAHRDTVAKDIEHVGRSQFGATVLAQLQEKIAAGSPVNQLLSIIQEIRDRLKLAQDEDSKQSTEYKRQCADEQQKLENEITGKEGDIEAKSAEIAAKERQIVNLSNLIDAYNKKIKDDADAIERISQNIGDNKAEMERDTVTWQSRKNDTRDTIAAVAEIKEIVATADLSRNQNDNAGNYALDATVYTGLFQKAMNRVTDKNLRSFLEVTQTAIRSMQAGDIDSLNNLLDDLTKDLQRYLSDLDTEHAENVRFFTEKNAALEGELVAANQLKTNDMQVRARHSEEKVTAQAELRELDNNKVELQTQLHNLRADKAAADQKCKDLDADYMLRSKDRTEEQRTLDEIENIVQNRLANSNEHLANAVAGVSV